MVQEKYGPGSVQIFKSFVLIGDVRRSQKQVDEVVKYEEKVKELISYWDKKNHR